MDQIGFAYQRFTKRFSHDRDSAQERTPSWSRDRRTGFTKASLGLPRPIHGPTNRDHPRPEHLDDPDCEPRNQRTKARYASPAHFHIEPTDHGVLVRVAAFPQPTLPELQSSRQFLQTFLRGLENDLQRRSRLKPRTTKETVRPSLPQGRVRAVLLEEKTKRNGWRAKHEESGLSGPIQNTALVPADKQPGDEVELDIAYANAETIAFKWPLPEKPKKKKGKSGGGRSGKRR